MVMKIREVWVWNPNSQEEENMVEWLPMRVITMVKYLSLVRGVGNEPIQQEVEYILCFHEGTGDTAEVPFAEAVIKSIYDEKTEKIINISPPPRKT